MREEGLTLCYCKMTFVVKRAIFARESCVRCHGAAEGGRERDGYVYTHSLEYVEPIFSSNAAASVAPLMASSASASAFIITAATQRLGRVGPVLVGKLGVNDAMPQESKETHKSTGF